MAATSLSMAKNAMRRAIDSIVDPWPPNTQPVWDFFGSRCAYCGCELVKSERRGHMDHATPGAGNHIGNLVLACSVCNGDSKRDEDWLAFLQRRIADPNEREEHVRRIRDWQEAHPQPRHTTSNEIRALRDELDEIIEAFAVKSVELRAKAREVRRSRADGAKQAGIGEPVVPAPGSSLRSGDGLADVLLPLGLEQRGPGEWRDAEGEVTFILESAGAFVGWNDVAWPHPSTPCRQLRDVLHLPHEDLSAATIADAVEHARRSRRDAVVVCRACGRPITPGHLYDERTCQGCASRELGVAY